MSRISRTHGTQGLFGSSLSRRRLLGQTGGIAAGTALAGAGLTAVRPSRAFAQDATEVTMWGNHPEWKDPMEEILAAFETAHPDVAVEFTPTPGPDYRAKLQTAKAGGEPSDILGEEDGTIITQVMAGGELPFIDLTGQIDISGLSGPARVQVEVGGRTFGCPLASYTVGIAYQRPIFAEHGITPPTTWDELLAVCDTLQNAGVTPFVAGAKDEVHPFFMYIGFASSVLGLEGFQAVRRGERSLTDPDLVAAMEMLKTLQPYFQSGFEATDYTTAKAIFANGLGAMEVAGTADFTGYLQVNPDADLGFMAWPGPEAGKSATNTGMELLYTVSAFADADKQAAATTFVNWLATTEAQQLVADKIALPINVNVTESSDRIRQETVAARVNDVPVWYSVPETGQTLTIIAAEQGGLWTDRLTPLQLVELIQATVTPNPDLDAGSATPEA